MSRFASLSARLDIYFLSLSYICRMAQILLALTEESTQLKERLL